MILMAYDRSADQTAVDVRALRALVTVADQGSFRGAARSLGYTQSAISHQIAGLERALDASMFTRPGGRGAVTLTAAGDAAYRRARRVLAELETLGADVAAIERGERPTLRIGVFQTATTELLPSALRTLRENRPDVEVVLSEIHDNGQAFDRLADGRLDIAFIVNPDPDERIQSIPLLDDRWVILTRRDSDLVGVRVAVVRHARRGRRRRLERGAGAPSSSSSRRGAGVRSAPASSTAPTTISRSSGWSPPVTATRAWTGSAPRARLSRR